MEFLAFSVPKYPLSRVDLQNFPTKGHIPFRNPCLGGAPRTPVEPLAITTTPIFPFVFAGLSLCVNGLQKNFKIVLDNLTVKIRNFNFGFGNYMCNINY